MHKKAYGFTLVELAVVIVVIAILAVISVVAYNGIQNRAKTTAYTNAADSTEKQIRLYQTMVGSPYGTYLDPIQQGNTTILPTACVGTMADFPADGDFSAGECWIRYNSDGSRREAVSVVEGLSNTFVQEDGHFGANKLPTVTHKSGGVVRYKARGIIITKFSGWTIGDQSGETLMIWLVPDKTSCGRGVGNETGNSQELQQMRPVIVAHIRWVDGEISTSQLVDEIINSAMTGEETVTPEGRAQLIQEMDALPEAYKQDIRTIYQAFLQLYDELLYGSTVCYRQF